jgi:hypothetical protein
MKILGKPIKFEIQDIMKCYHKEQETDTETKAKAEVEKQQTSRQFLKNLST